jgi:hypothetical protein
VLAGLAPELRCTSCGADRSLLLDAREEDEREVRAGTLECVRCATRFAVADGVAELMAEAPEPVAREAAGLERFAEVIARRRLGSPAHPAPARGAERLQRTAFEQLLRTVSPERGARLLGVGSNTCWASNLFARRGLSVVAVDIALTEMQGLRTAHWFLDDGCPHFERVLGSMFNLPFAGESLDYVFCSQVRHHRDPVAGVETDGAGHAARPHWRPRRRERQLALPPDRVAWQTGGGDPRAGRDTADQLGSRTLRHHLNLDPRGSRGDQETADAKALPSLDRQHDSSATHAVRARIEVRRD